MVTALADGLFGSTFLRRLRMTLVGDMLLLPPRTFVVRFISPNYITNLDDFDRQLIALKNSLE